MDEEISFPRGFHTPTDGTRTISKDESKKSPTTGRKEKRKRSQSDDFLFGTKLSKELDHSKKTKTKKKLKSSSSSQGNSSSFSRSKSEISTAGALSMPSSVLPIGGGAVLQPISGGSSKAAFIEAVSFQKMAKGIKLLGIIREVSSDYALVSLPNMLTGYIRRDDKAKLGLDKVIQVGMVLSVVVLKATSETVAQSSSKHRSKEAPIVKKRIELAISPIHVNDGWTSDTLYESMTLRGRIKSVEDHGCIVDVSVAGVGGNSCFLKFENIEGGFTLKSDDDGGEDNEDEEGDAVMEETDESSHQMSNQSKSTFIINKGRIYDFTVISIPSKFDKTSSTSVIQLSLETGATRSQRVTEPKKKSPSFTLRSLNAGMLVPVSIEHHARNGLCVTFLGNVFRGAIEMAHLGGYFSDKLSSLLQRLGKETSSEKREMWWKEVFSGKLSDVRRGYFLFLFYFLIKLFSFTIYHDRSWLG